MRVGYERVTVGDRSYLICAVCQQPLVKGYGVCYAVPENGEPIHEQARQALCGPHYREQYVKTYGFEPKGRIPDNTLTARDVVSLEVELIALEDSQRGASVDSLLAWTPERLSGALETARGSEWVESVASARVRLDTEPRVEMTGDVS